MDTSSGLLTYATIVGRLKDHFAVPQSELFRRFIFRKRRQLPGKSVQQFVANLCGLAGSCKFGALQDEMVRDELIEHMNNPEARKTLLLEADDLSLSRALTITLQIESAAECSAILTQQVATLTLAGPPNRPLAPLPLPPDSSVSDVMQLRRQPPQARTPPPCANCGSWSHASRAPAFTARGQTCHHCGKQNHFAKVCRSAPAGSDSHTYQPQSTTTIIHHVNSGLVTFKSCTLNSMGCACHLDTGASVSLINFD